MDVGQCMAHAAQDSPRNQQPKRKHVLKQKLVSLTQVLLANGWWMLVIEAFTHTYIYYITSRTAQGGGGSFKDREPIGEVCFCDARKAERTH